MAHKASHQPGARSIKESLRQVEPRHDPWLIILAGISVLALLTLAVVLTGHL